jgi:hypothetical protein
MPGEVAVLAAEAMPFATAALGTYGKAVLSKATDDAADATVSAGRKLLQLVFGRKRDDEALPQAVAEMIEYPGDEDYLAALRLAIRQVLESNARLQAEVRAVINAGAAAGSVNQRVTVGRDAYTAGRDMTITRPAD